MTSRISKARMIVNGAGCAVAIVACAAFAVSLLSGLASLSPPVAGDPDGHKGIAVNLFAIALCGLIGTAALVSLIRTVRTWRSLGKE
ncbi:MAG: hypothetical protein NDI88_15180 [Lysobacter sp.]|nr:hypothetical protein [Lysobacter sp.]